MSWLNLFFYGCVLILTVVLIYMDYKDYECHQLITENKKPNPEYCLFLCGLVPEDDDSKEDRKRKIDKLLEKTTHLVQWRRMLLIAMLCTLFVGWYLTEGLLKPIQFVVCSLFIFVVGYITHTWKNYHLDVPYSMTLRKNIQML